MSSYTHMTCQISCEVLGYTISVLVCLCTWLYTWYKYTNLREQLFKRCKSLTDKSFYKRSHCFGQYKTHLFYITFLFHNVRSIPYNGLSLHDLSFFWLLSICFGLFNLTNIYLTRKRNAPFSPRLRSINWIWCRRWFNSGSSLWYKWLPLVKLIYETLSSNIEKNKINIRDIHQPNFWTTLRDAIITGLVLFDDTVKLLRR